MKNENKELIIRELTSLQNKIKLNLEEKNINARGVTSSNIVLKIDEKSFSLQIQSGDNAPKNTLEIGRGSGKIPPVSKITEWIDAKPFDYSGFKGKDDAKKKRSAAWAIAKKIEKVGTDRHFDNVNVYSEEVELCKSKLTYFLRNEILNSIKFSTK